MITFDNQSCTGCRTCEMACSYHHAGVFQPSIASIEITGSANEGFKMTLHEGPQDNRAACDGCRELEEPLCVTFCPAVARSGLEKQVTRFRERHSG